MISVQNRQRQLSGSKLLMLVFIFFALHACAAKKITTSKNAEVVEIVKPMPNSAAINGDSITQKPVIFDVEEVKQPIIAKPTTSAYDHYKKYNIAVLLPFNLEQIPIGRFVIDSTKLLSAETTDAIQFYLGTLLAKQRILNNSLTANIYFLDVKGDSASVLKALNSKPFPKVDYIVGPLFSKTLKMVADYANSKQIPMISPLVNSMYIKENPNYFNANASLKSQYSFLLDEIKKDKPYTTIEVLYDGTDSTAESISILKDIVDNTKKISNIKYTSVKVWEDATKTLATSDTTSERVILLYSSKEPYIKSIMGKLKPLKNKLKIYTSSCMRYSKGLADLKLTDDIYTAYPYNSNNVNFKQFTDRYASKFQKTPDETAYQAYDLMMHLFYMIDKHQTLTDNSYINSLDFDNTQSKFLFKPVLNKEGKVDYYDNTNLYLYQFINGAFSIAKTE